MAQITVPLVVVYCAYAKKGAYYSHADAHWGSPSVQVQNKHAQNASPGWARSSRKLVLLRGASFCYNRPPTGHWRSWLARFHGMEEVKGSNPLCSTTNLLEYFFDINIVRMSRTVMCGGSVVTGTTIDLPSATLCVKGVVVIAAAERTERACTH